jgi:hypothetical protein
MKFILIMYACSTIANGCGVPVQDPQMYNSYKECAVAASEISIVALNSMNKDMVNKEQIFFGFFKQILYKHYPQVVSSIY